MPPNDSLGSDIQAVLQELPAPIRAYVKSGKQELLAKSLMIKYHLHIDQAAILEREIMLLLMGIETPDDFVAALKDELTLDDAAVDGITKDVNEQIFMPLQRQMRIESETAQARPVPKPMVATPRYAAPQPPTANFQQSTAPPLNRAAPGAARSGEPPPAVLTPQAPESVQKLASSLHDVIKEVTSKPAAPAMPAPLPPRAVMPAPPRPSMPPAPVPRPENLPGAQGNAGWPPARQQPTNNSQQPTQPLKPQAIPPPPPPRLPGDDPYREPIE